MLRSAVMWWFGLSLAGLTTSAVASAGVSAPIRAAVEQAVIAAIPAWHGKKAQIIKYLDLTQPFATWTPWALVVAQSAGPPPDPEWTDHRTIAVCLVGVHATQCTDSYWQTPDGGESWFARPYDLRLAQVVHTRDDATQPLLVVATCSVPGIDGNCSIRTTLYRYDRNVDLFRRVFVHDSHGSNNNQAARFVEHGPLQGDVIVDYPTDRAPYVYWIEVYAPGKSGQYARILRYRSSTHYADGNPLPVADSEMPAIMERLGLWKPGDALPVPQPLPAGCGQLVLNHGEEWCRNLCVNYGGNACDRFTKSRRSEIRDR